MTALGKAIVHNQGFAAGWQFEHKRIERADDNEYPYSEDPDFAHGVGEGRHAAKRALARRHEHREPEPEPCDQHQLHF
jgi:hypothetical protein